MQENKWLIIKNLDARVTEDNLKSILQLISPTLQVQIIKNTNTLNHGIVEFTDVRGAEQAFHTMDKRSIHNQQIDIEWYNSTQQEDVEMEVPTTLSYEEIFAQSPLYITSIAVKNMAIQDIVTYFQQFGTVQETLVGQVETIVTLDTHSNATKAIYNSQKLQSVQVQWHHSNILTKSNSIKNLFQYFKPSHSLQFDLPLQSAFSLSSNHPYYS